jgi:3',5'-cyclic AMP phosphodiesterase CpdA
MVSTKFDNPGSTANQSPVNAGSPAKRTITLIHLSDPHISCVDTIRVQDLLSKRIFGFLRWKLHRGAEHKPGVLKSLQKDLASAEPDHIAVTGDLTHLSLPAEFIKAAHWLQSLGPPSRVTVIPGNHDAYVKANWRQGWSHWTEYMLGDNYGEPDRAVRHPDNIFPSLRVRGSIALIGINTARPSAPHLAIGSVGAEQLQKLEAILAQTSEQQLYRVLLVHHPPAPGTVSWRRRLTDAAALRSLIARYGADLILHGHAHRVLQNYLPTPTGRVPVMGAPSASALGRTPERRARYYIYRIIPATDSWNVDLTVRVYSLDKDCFTTEREQRFSNRQ